MARIELPWLIKSSGRILGPYTTEKVSELLRGRDVSMLDEVALPGRRWQTIQYVDTFRDVIDSLRKSTLSERTEATWNQTGTNLTQTLTDLDAGTMTDELSQSGFTSTAKEIVVHDVREEPTSAAPAGQGRYQPQHGQNTAIQRQVETTTRGLWIVTIVVLALAAAFIVRKRLVPAAGEARVSTPGIRQTVLGLIQIGHYGDALRELKTSVGDQSPVSDMSIYYGSLLIQVEGQTVLGRRWLNAIIAAKRPELKQALTGLGVADLIDGQLDQANDNLERALALDPDYVPAIVDLSIVAIRRGDLSRARELSQRALRLSPNQGEALLTLAEAQVAVFRKNPTAVDLAGLSKTLKQYRRTQWDFAGEVGFYDVLIDALRHEPDVPTAVRTYLDTDPALTNDHRHNVFIYRGRVQWSALARVCEQMTDQLGAGPYAATFLASCYAREARWDAARTTIERAVHQAPKDPLVQAWYSYVLRESGDADQASVVLGRATEFNRKGEFTLPSLLQARFCQTAGIVDCARSWWQKIFERDLEYLPAVAGLAWTQSRGGSKSEVVNLTQKGLKISPDYIPLLELRQKAEADGSYPTN